VRPDGLIPRSLRAALGLAALALTACAAPSPSQPFDDYVRWAKQQGLLRTDYAPLDAPFTNADLARNFERVVFFSEYAEVDDIRPQPTASELSRWVEPIRYQVTGGGATVADRAEADALARRFQRLTGLTFEKARNRPNLMILIGDQAARRDFARVLRATVGDQPYLRPIERNRNQEPCFGFLFSDPQVPGVITGGLIIIKAETSGVLRQSCLHEEFAQVLGAQNDSDEIRPSLFNDVNEFALLTEHDEFVLRILYDPRLEPGMTAPMARSIVRRIIRELRPDGGPLP
jgi:hypothetical protein